MTVDQSALQELIDRQGVEDTLYRYASSIDTKDFATLRPLLADDAVAQYGDDTEPIVGGDVIVAWIEQMTADRSWQHHFFNVYHVDLDGDVARALTYHTSHSTGEDSPDTVLVIVARYHDELRRTDGRWQIVDKRMHIGWTEQRTYPQAAMAEQTVADQEAALARAGSGPRSSS